MFYRISDDIALRKWKYIERAIYKKGVDHALGITKEEFDCLFLCDGDHDLKDDEVILKLLKKGFISKCQKGEKVSSWSRFKEYDNYYFPRMNLMITGKCNLNCLHCFNAKDNEKLNTELSYQDIIGLLDQAKDIGIHAFTITGGEPLFHPRFMDIIKEIYKRDMYVFELNTNGLLITQKMLDEFKEIGCNPLMKISFDGISYHNIIRQNEKAEELTIKAIKLCIKNGFAVKVQTQVNLNNIDTLLKTAKLLDSLGVSKMRLIRTTEAPRWEQNAPLATIPIEEYYQLMLDFAKQYIALGLDMEIDIWQFIKLYPKKKAYKIVPILCNKDEYNIRIPMCKGNRGMIAVSSSGEVVPCLQMSGYFMEKGISLANFKEKPLKEIIAKSDYLDLAMAPLLRMLLENKKCSNCQYFMACTGGCPALGLLYSGKKYNFYHEDITKCYFFEHGWYDKIKEEINTYYLQNPLNI